MFVTICFLVDSYPYQNEIESVFLICISLVDKDGQTFCIFIDHLHF